MKFKFLLLTLLVLGSTQSFARQCWNSKGYNVVDSINYDLSTTFDQNNNVLGQSKDITLNFNKPIQAICETASFPYGLTVRSYITNEPIVENTGTFKYLRINDYLLGAMKINDSAVNTFYPPIKKTMGYDPNSDNGNAFSIRDSDLLLRIKVVKPFVGNVSIPSKTMFTVYVTTSDVDPLRYPVYTISYSGRIVAPQSCTIDSGKVLDIQFGDILASEFNQAGAGNKPHSINPETRSVSVQCSNMNAAATLTFRIESEKSQGDMLVSNNDDVGFKISDMSDNVLIPNNLLSFSEFKLNQSQQATLSFKTWPVSVTGKKPAVGPFSSRAYIRIDFP
ncbi:fimbrial protein [Acinetobacter bereziniae]|nr:fimbrial protein [Acinetobacter bereziniae]MDA3440908.1 fimbrial protein [Acinetobacter bereziniae]